jgi:hypothetical protein
MRIDPSSNNAGAYRPPAQNAAGDSISQNIEKQIERLQERLREIAAKKDMPMEIKREQQNQLNEQIAQLRQQLFARRRELQQEKMEAQSAQQLAPETDEQSVSMSGGQMQAFAQAGSAMTQIKSKEHVRTGLKGEAKKIGFEISLDSSRGLDVTDKLTALAGIESKLDNISKDMAKDMSGAVKSFKDAAEQDEKSEESKDEDAAVQSAEKQDEDGSGSSRTDHVDTFA